MAATSKTTATTGSSRKHRSAARSASRPSTDRRAVEPDVDEVTAADAQEIEAEGYVTAALCDEDVRIMPPSTWRASWQSLLGQGQIAAFVELVVHPDDLEVFWDVDPTGAEFGEFLDDATRQAGESPGNSRGPATSSRRMRRR